MPALRLCSEVFRGLALEQVHCELQTAAALTSILIHSAMSVRRWINEGDKRTSKGSTLSKRIVQTELPLNNLGVPPPSTK